MVAYRKRPSTAPRGYPLRTGRRAFWGYAEDRIMWLGRVVVLVQADVDRSGWT
jgi:hypothetical protein